MKPVESLPVSDSHSHIALDGEEISLDGEWMCLIYQIKFKLLNNLGNELVQLNL